MMLPAGTAISLVPTTSKPKGVRTNAGVGATFTVKSTVALSPKASVASNFTVNAAVSFICALLLTTVPSVMLKRVSCVITEYK